MLDLTVPEGYAQQVDDLLKNRSISVSEDTYSTELQTMLDTIRKGGAIRANAFSLDQDSNYGSSENMVKMTNSEMEARLKEDNTALLIASEEGAVFCLCYIKSGDHGYLQFLDPNQAQAQAQAFDNLAIETGASAPNKLNIFQRIVNALSEFFLHHPSNAARRIEAYQNFYSNIQRANEASGRIAEETKDGAERERQQRSARQVEEADLAWEAEMAEFYPLHQKALEEKLEAKRLRDEKLENVKLGDEKVEEVNLQEKEKLVESQPQKDKDVEEQPEEVFQEQNTDSHAEIRKLEFQIKNSRGIIKTCNENYTIQIQVKDHYKKEVDRLENEAENRGKFKKQAEDRVTSAENALKEIEQELEKNQQESAVLAEQKDKEHSELEIAKQELIQREAFLKAAESGALKAAEQLTEHQANEKFYNMKPDDYLKHIHDTEKAQRLDAFDKEKAVRENQILEQQQVIEACKIGIKSMEKNLNRKDRNTETDKQLTDLKTQLSQAEAKKKELQLEGETKQKEFKQIEKDKAKEQRNITEEQRTNVKQWQEEGRQDLANARNNYKSCTDMLAAAGISYNDQKTMVEDMEMRFQHRWLDESAIDRVVKERQQDLLQRKEAATNDLDTNKSKLDKINTDMAQTEKKLNKSKEHLKDAIEEVESILETRNIHKENLERSQWRLEELRPSKNMENSGPVL